jgi:hypothetical protein
MSVGRTLLNVVDQVLFTTFAVVMAIVGLFWRND